MPPVSTIQNAFSSGELSSSLYSRTDVARYAIGLRKCRNFIIHPQGGVSNRAGTVFVAETKDSTKKCRMFKFIFNEEQSYVLEFGDYYVRFFTEQAQVLGAPTATWNSATTYALNDWVTHNAAHYLSIQASISQNPATATTYWTQQTQYEIYSPYAEADLDDLMLEGSADVISITHPDYQTQTLSRYGATDWRFENDAHENGPFMPDNIDESISLNVSAVSGTNVTLTSASSLFDALHVGALFKLNHYIEGQVASASFTTETWSAASIKCFTTWRLITHGTWTAKFNIEKSDDGITTNPASWTVLRSFSGADDTNINTYGTEDIDLNEVPFYLRINVTDHTSGTLSADLTTDAFYQEGIVQVLTWNSATSVQAEVLKEAGLTTNTVDWAEGSWSNYRGWPRVCRYYNDRLVFAGTASEPMTIWMSEISDYTSFVRHSILLDSDGITTSLTSRQLNAINGLVALKKLVVFTSSSEWTVGPNSGTPLTPTSFLQEVEGYRGSSGIDPVVIGNECIYVQSNAKVLRSFAYQFSSDGMVGSDLNILSRHLFENYTIKEIAYQQDPDSLVWCLRNDGVLLSLTYMPEQDVLGWSWHDTTGTVESICVIPYDGRDELWMVVQRENGRYIERLSQRLKPSSSGAVDITDQIFMDSAISFTSNASITGLTHLEGQIVSIIDGGNVHAQETVVGGLISLTMSAASSTVHIGLPYYSDLETLNIEMGMKDGTLQGKKVKIGNVMFRIVNTRGGWIGPDSNNIYEAFPTAISEKLNREEKFYEDDTIFNYDDPDITYDGVPNEYAIYTGDIRLPLGAGYEDGGRVFYRQVDPLPVTISCIVPEVTPGQPAG